MDISIPSSSRSACYTPLASQSTPLRMLRTHSVFCLSPQPSPPKPLYYNLHVRAADA